MFDKKSHPSAGEITALLGKGSEFEGKLSFTGMVRLDGNFSGEIFSEGQLIIGEEACIKAEINVDNVVICGEVEGNVHAKSRVELRSPGRLTGDIKTDVLVIEEGVTFDGTCQMSSGRAQKKHISLVEGGSGEKEMEEAGR